MRHTNNVSFEHQMTRTERTPVQWVDVVVQTEDLNTLQHLCRVFGGYSAPYGPWTARLTTVEADAVDAWLGASEEARQARAGAMKTVNERMREAFDRQAIRGRSRKSRP